jgi:hypothetical protein
VLIEYRIKQAEIEVAAIIENRRLYQERYLQQNKELLDEMKVELPDAAIWESVEKGEKIKIDQGYIKMLRAKQIKKAVKELGPMKAHEFVDPEKAKKLFRKIVLLCHPDKHNGREEYLSLARKAFEADDVKTLENIFSHLQDENPKLFSLTNKLILENKLQRILFQRHVLLKDKINADIFIRGVDAVLKSAREELESQLSPKKQNRRNTF